MRNIRCMGLLAFVLMFMSGSATLQADPVAGLSHIETDLSGGFWQYEFTLTNLSDPTEDAGFDLYDLYLGFDDSTTIAAVAMPVGWDYTTGLGFIDVFSTIPGISPDGSDIAPGNSLSGFVLQLDDRAEEFPFEAMFVNPSDPDNPLVYEGNAPTIPEPATLALISGGLAGLLFLRRSRRASESKPF